jgi:hypothetical protein
LRGDPCASVAGDRAADPCSQLVVRLAHAADPVLACARLLRAAAGVGDGDRRPRVVSAHCCSSPQLFSRIYATGGAITEPVGSAQSWIAQLRTDKAQRSSKYELGFVCGSDMNGLADQPGPSQSTRISCPFTSYEGRVTFTRERWGARTFDFNADGLANYGLYADWLQAVQRAGVRPSPT